MSVFDSRTALCAVARNQSKQTTSRRDGGAPSSKLLAPLWRNEIKIDVQGAEMKVLEGSRQFLSIVDTVLVQVGYLALYGGQATSREVMDFLDEFDLTFVGIIDQYVGPSNSLPGYGDTLFVKRALLERGRNLSGSGRSCPWSGV